jgi:ketosteroid isomerase-like protein
MLLIPPLPISVGLLLLTIFGINAPDPVPPDPVAQDRAAIEASLREAMQGSPTIELTSGDVRLFGDQAVTWGTWAVEATGPTGDPMASSGAYITYLERVEGAWRIRGSLSNYDSPPAEWAWAEGGEAPPLESRMTDLIRDYETRWNLSNPGGVADLYVSDAVVAYADQPVLHGRPAVAPSLRERMDAAPTTIKIHGVGTTDLQEGWALDFGWYEMAPAEGGERVRWGVYMALVERTEGGEWRLRWDFSHGRPAGGM